MLKRTVAVTALLSGIACGSTSSSPAAPSTVSTTFSLSGQVTDATSSAAIAGATVSIADGPNAAKTGMTDASGNYTLSGLQPGGFTVGVAVSGYVSASKAVNPPGCSPD